MQHHVWKQLTLYKEPQDCEVSKTPETVDDIMENLILEIHPYSSYSTNILFI